MNEIQKILIVEDSPTQALQLQMTLEDKNYEVLHGANGEEALQLLEENQDVNVIISDIVMPVMDGYTFCKKVKSTENLQEIPVILLTQLSNPDDVIKGLQSGADNFISKPYADEFLFGRINDILLNREIRKRSPNLDIAMEIYFGGQKYILNSNRLQILDLLLSTYYNAINKNKELEEKNVQLSNLHKELKRNNIQLKRSIDEKNHLLGIAAHDLRSPLALVSSYFDLLSESLAINTIDNQDKIISTISTTINFMLNLITDVLDYTKIEAGKLELDYNEFNLIEFMNLSIEMNNILSSKKNIQIQSQYPADDLNVTADYNKLKQVMDNLLSNAMKYSEANTIVQVFIKDLEDEVEIQVADQGKGIPADELGKIFQPFVTTSVQSTGGERSTGLGLVSVKKIIETHGGKIWVESVDGQGSSFYFKLPKNKL